MKFMMPNRYRVYLHDTPSRYLFSRPMRAFSHGCIRLEHPEAFASFLLDGQMSAQEIEAALHSQPDSVRRLGRPIPVYIVYFTAFMKDGLVHFRDDIYQNDPAIGRALEESRRTGNRPT
jgi:murein L,D-transpeptidase YcbB/YkuD